MNRRELFQILGATFLKDDGERKTLRRSLDVLLPPDGSVAAVYIDAMLAHGSDSMRSDWRTGLAQLSRVNALTDEAALAWFGELDSSGDRFFATFKRAAIDAYYLSEAGRSSLGYRGDTAVHHFSGCTHPEHQ